MQIDLFLPPTWTPRLLAFAKWVHLQHGDQKRKYTGLPYAVHLIRVANQVWLQTGSEVLAAAGLGHDLLEDTPTSKSEILTFLSTLNFTERETQQVLELIIELTDVYEKKDFPDLNRRQRKALEAARLSQISPDAQLIKWCDIRDNLNSFQQYDRNFMRVFLREVEAFTSQWK